MSARIAQPATDMAHVLPSYASAHSRSELHTMLDALIDNGGQWLVEMHFAAWISRRPQPRAQVADTPPSHSMTG